jgi:hypothetical protein
MRRVTISMNPRTALTGFPRASVTEVGYEKNARYTRLGASRRYVSGTGRTY